MHLPPLPGRLPRHLHLRSVPLLSGEPHLVHRGPVWQVWRGSEAGTGRTLVLKGARRPSESTAALLDAEAAVLASLPAGRTVLPVGLVRRPRSVQRLLVTEDLPGGSLDHLVDSRPGGLGPEAVTGLLVDLVRSLDAVHAAGWVHGRVTASHVLVGLDRRAVLAGFGAARGRPGAAAGRREAADDLAQAARLGRSVLDPDRPHDGLRSVLDRLDHPDPARRPDAADAVELLRRFGPVPAPLPCPGPGPGPATATAPVDLADPVAAPDPGSDADPGLADRGEVARVPAGRSVPPWLRAAAPLVAAIAGSTLVAVVGHDVVTGDDVASGAGTARCSDAPDLPTAAADGGFTDEADVEGRGCTFAVRWSAAEAELTVAAPDGVRRYRLGEPGDRVQLGDWDCDGDATPLLVRGDGAHAYRFDAWPSSDTPATPVTTSISASEAPVPACGGG